MGRFHKAQHNIWTLLHAEPCWCLLILRVLPQVSVSFRLSIYHIIDKTAISVYDLPHMPRGERERRVSSPEQEDKLQAALQTLEAGIDSILSSEGFAAYLKTLARFHSYSPSNVALIWTKSSHGSELPSSRHRA